MTDISLIVDVTTSLASRVATSTGFGTPLVVGYHTLFSDRVREYTKLSGLAADGFGVNTAIYRAAAAIFQQSPTVKSLKVGRLATAANVEVLTLTPVVQNVGRYTVTIDGVDTLATPAQTYTPTATNLAVYTVTLGGVAYTYTADSSATAAEIVAGLIAAINADTATHGVTSSGSTTLILTLAPGKTTNIVTTSNLGAAAANTATEIGDAIRAAIAASTAAGKFTTSGTSTVILTGATAGSYPDVQVSSNLTTQNTTPDNGFATDLTAINAEDNDWYGLVLTGTGKAEVLAAATAIEPLKKQLFALTSDFDVLNTAYAVGDDASDDIATRLKNLGFTRTHLSFSMEPGRYMNAAVAGDGLRNQPGAATYALRPLVGIPADTLSDTQTSRLLVKNVNFMMNTAGLTFTSNNGVNSVGAPYYTDIRVLVDYFDARIAERILSALVTAPRIPLTDAGISGLKGVVRAFLLGEEERGTVVEGSTVVTAPKRADLSDGDLLARFLNGIEFFCIASGATHKVGVNGSVSQTNS